MPGAEQKAVTETDLAPTVETDAIREQLKDQFLKPFSKNALRSNPNMWLSGTHFGSVGRRAPYRIDGWLAERGTSVWYGAGSTGKTQLLLWMAATLATRIEDRTSPPDEYVWLGGKVHGTGHVLILTAEDTREHIVGRIHDIVVETMGQDEQTAARTCDRLHLMPFLRAQPKIELSDFSSL